jgi:hypothetical protein
MYKLIGIDGQEYGPATAEQIRQWIRERRVDRHTRIFTQDAVDWTPACLVPEFANEFPAEAPAAGPATPPALTAPLPPVRSRVTATLGLVCGILSVTVCCCCCGLPFNFLGLLFSIIALVQISGNPERHGGRAMAIIGLVLSILGLLLLVGYLALR